MARERPSPWVIDRRVCGCVQYAHNEPPTTWWVIASVLGGKLKNLKLNKKKKNRKNKPTTSYFTRQYVKFFWLPHHRRHHCLHYRWFRVRQLLPTSLALYIPHNFLCIFYCLWFIYSFWKFWFLETLSYF